MAAKQRKRGQSKCHTNLETSPWGWYLAHSLGEPITKSRNAVGVQKNTTSQRKQLNPSRYAFASPVTLVPTLAAPSVPLSPGREALNLGPIACTAAMRSSTLLAPLECSVTDLAGMLTFTSENTSIPCETASAREWEVGQRGETQRIRKGNAPVTPGHACSARCTLLPQFFMHFMPSTRSVTTVPSSTPSSAEAAADCDSESTTAGLEGISGSAGDDADVDLSFSACEI